MLTRLEYKKLFMDNNLNEHRLIGKNQLDTNSKYDSKENFGNTLSNLIDTKDFTHSNYTQSSNQFSNSLTKTTKNDSLTFDQYTSVINMAMSRYEGNKMKEESFEEIITTKKPIDMRKSHRASQSLLNIKKHVAFLPIITENSDIKVSAHMFEFYNPIESYGVLENNKKVFCEIKRTNFDRQENLYRNTLDKIKNDNFRLIEKIPKIKIIDMFHKKKTNDVFDRRKTSIIMPIINPNKDEKRADDSKKNILDYLSLPFFKAHENEFNSYYKKVGKSFPEVSDQFAFHGDKSFIYLWGGLNSSKSNYLWSMNTETFEWTKHIPYNDPPFQRFGHKGLFYLRKLYMLGGRTKENNYTSFPWDVDIYDVDNHTWSSQNFYSHASLIQRRNHVAEIIGNQIIIHGGITENNEYMNDTLLINLSPLKFTQCVIKDDAPGPCLAGHACALVVPSDIRNNVKFHIYKNLDGNFPRKSHNAIKEKGWYVFGGKSKENDAPSNELWILRIGKKPLEWIKPNVSGRPPSPRSAHSMDYYEPRNFLIVHGGMNEYNRDSFALDDTFIFDLKKFEWKEIKLWSKTENLLIQKRYGHKTQINGKIKIFNINLLDNKLIIFGGMNCYNYIGSSLFIIDLDNVRNF